MKIRTDHNGIVLPPRKKKKKPTTQNDIFEMPDQNKYTGPKTVPATSVAAYNESATQKKMSSGVAVARNLVRKFPDRTAYELLNYSQTFTDIYDLRRYLSELKKEGGAYNPKERVCTVAKRKTFTWRLV